MKKLKWLLAVVLVYVIYAVGFNVGANGKITNLAVPLNIKPHLTQDPKLVGDAQELGIDYSQVNLEFTPTNPTSTIEKSDEPAVGVFIYPNTIQIKTGLSKKDELTIVAYEYMHYVWKDTSTKQQQQLAKQLRVYRSWNPDFNADVSRYHGTPETIDNELHSTVCTHVQPYLLSNSFNNYCNQFIKNRSILFQ